MRAYKFIKIFKQTQKLIIWSCFTSNIFLFSVPNENKQKLKVLFPIPCIGGEADMGVRLEKAARNIGWEAQAFFFDSRWGVNSPIDFFRVCKPFQIPTDQLNYFKNILLDFKPDFILSLAPKIYCPKSFGIPHYLALTKSHEANINFFGNKMLKFEGYLCTPQDEYPLKNFLNLSNKNIPQMLWVPTTLKTKYEPLQIRKLFYCGVQWDYLRKSKPYEDCIKSLDRTGLMEVYGPKDGFMKDWNLVSYKGEIPYDAVSLNEVIKKCGAALLLHSQEHLQHDVISGRIFEAAAAGAVIISDRHKFIEKEFGDTVLYIDIDKNNKLSAEEMFKQINNHLSWILDNPDQALEMAQKAHAIFDAKFTLEAQLKRLGDFHNQHKMFYDFSEIDLAKVRRAD
jgi:glycosyltransferase involved in cell wall biosynthesis